MIDIDAGVISAVDEAVKEAHPKCFVSGEYLRTESRLPAVTVLETSNYAPVSAATSSTVESYARITYQVDVYSAHATKKKSECRAILQTVDECFARMGFRRIFLQPLPNINNATIYRITARYAGTVTGDGMVGR